MLRDDVHANRAFDAPLIRSAELEEAASILALWQAADTHPTVTDTLSSVRRLIAEHPGAILLAEVDGDLAGTIIAASDGWRGNLYRLAVRPEMRRRGIARALVAEALRRFSDLGIQRVSAFVIASDDPALAFWNSLADLGVRPDPAPKARFVVNLSGET